MTRVAAASKQTSADESKRGGGVNRAYIGLRKDLLALIGSAPRTVLDVGCAQGANGRWLKEQYGSAVSGIELDPEMGAEAQKVLGEVRIGDLNRTTLLELYGGRSFDLILMGDVLEHLIDPWTALQHARTLLAPGGCILTSLPNINHYTTLLCLTFLQRWPYRSRGIHDRTHLRFFTRRNMLEMYRAAGLTVDFESRNLRIVDAPAGWNSIAKVFDFHPFRAYFTYQYLHRLGPVG